MSLKIVWLCTIAGFGWFAYFAVPTFITGSILLAQGTIPDWSFKDMANLGGFATFASAMYFLHRESIKTFREELKAERDTRATHFEKMSATMEAHTLGVLNNTTATNTLTNQITDLAREMRKTS